MAIRWVEGSALRPYVPPAEPAGGVVEGAAPIYSIRPVGPVRSGSRPIGRAPRKREGEEEGRPHPLGRMAPPPPPPAHERRPALLASEVMSAPVATVPSDEPVLRALARMRERGFRHLPVLDAESRLVGIVTERDLLRLGVEPDRVRAGRERRAEGRRVEEAMTTRVLTAMPQTPIREIAAVMVAERIGCLPILDELARLAGIVTATDILRCLQLPEPLDLWI